MKKERIAYLLLIVILFCAITIFVCKFSDLKVLMAASSAEITHWFPRFGKIWLSARPIIVSTSKCIFAISVFLLFFTINLKFLKTLWLIIKTITSSLLLYLVFCMVYGPIFITLLVGGMLCLFVFKYSADRHLFKEAFQKYLIRNQNIALAITSSFITLFLAELLLRHAGINDSYGEQKGDQSYRSPFSAEKTGWYHIREAHDTRTYKNAEYTYHYSTNS